MTQPAESPNAVSIIETLPQNVAPAEEAAVAAETPAAAPEAKDEKVAKRFEALKSSEIRSRKAAAEARTAIEQAATEKADIAKQRAELEKREDLLKHDPIAALQALGVEDVKAWLERAVKPASEESRRLAELERREKAREAQDAEAKTKASADESSAREHKQMVAFVGSISPDEHPHTVARYEPHEIPAVVKRVLAEHGPAFKEQYGRKPTAEEVRDYIEAESKEWASADHRRAVLPKIFQNRQAAGDGSTQSGEGTAGATPSGQENGSGHQGANGPRTLTNDHAAQATTGRTPRALTREERKRALAAQLDAEEAARRTTG